MELKLLEQTLAVCKVRELRPQDVTSELCFAARTDEECSLVCPSAAVPVDALAVEDGWRALRIQGVLEFSLVGILAPIAAVLAQSGVPIFAVSTYNTDYVLVKGKQLPRALDALRQAGYTVV